MNLPAHQRHMARRRRFERQVAQADTAALRMRALRGRRDEVLEELRKLQTQLDGIEEELDKWSGVAAVFHAEAIAGRKRNPEVA